MGGWVKNDGAALKLNGQMFGGARGSLVSQEMFAVLLKREAVRSGDNCWGRQGLDSETTQET
jgi:hypothetical protein